MVERTNLLYLQFQSLKFLQLGTNLTWHDAYCQQCDGFFFIESIFNYQMLYQIQKR